MTLSYKLNENDFLQSQLFTASKSESIKKQRIRNWVIASISLLLLSSLFHDSDDEFLYYYFLILGIAAVFLYPQYSKYRYKKYYKKFIQENFKSKFDEVCTIVFTDDFINTSDRTGTSSIKLTEIDRGFETGEYFYLRLKTAQTLIIPKSVIDNIDIFRKWFIELLNKLQVEFISEPNWRWK